MNRESYRRDLAGPAAYQVVVARAAAEGVTVHEYALRTAAAARIATAGREAARAAEAACAARAAEALGAVATPLVVVPEGR